MNNNILSFEPALRSPSESPPVPRLDRMISELILLHEEMIVQLRVECEEAVDNVDFIRGMIEQHGQTAAMLRAKLENDETDTTSDCVIAGTRFTAEKSLVAIRARRGRA